MNGEQTEGGGGGGGGQSRRKEEEWGEVNTPRERQRDLHRQPPKDTIDPRARPTKTVLRTRLLEQSGEEEKRTELRGTQRGPTVAMDTEDDDSRLGTAAPEEPSAP